MTKRTEPGSVSKRYGSDDPDPYQNVTDPEHLLFVLKFGRHLWRSKKIYIGLSERNYFCHKKAEKESDSTIMNLGKDDGVSNDTNWMTSLILGAPRVTT